MISLGFNNEFVNPVKEGVKTSTIRKHFNGKIGDKIETEGQARNVADLKVSRDYCRRVFEINMLANREQILMDKYEEYMEYEREEQCVLNEDEACWFCGECGKEQFSNAL